MGKGVPRRGLDLADIQGNIVRPYGRFGFPIARHLFFNIASASAGRRFIERTRHAVTTAERWAGTDGAQDRNAPSRPQVAVNIGLSFLGFLALELSTRTLRGLPEEFIDGMAKRSHILGDVGASAPDRWDPIWVAAANERGRQIHIWISLSAQAKPDGTPVDALAERTEWLQSAALESGGVVLLDGHRGGDAMFQGASALMRVVGRGQKVPTAKEHFGFTDAIGDPVFIGQFEPATEASEVFGNGKLVPGKKSWWAPLATGEFVLGHASEAQELTPTAPPWSFMRNGTFMAYRKLHQNVASFRDYVKQRAKVYERAAAMESEAEAEATLGAKMVGRWSNGIPLAVAPTFQASQELAAKWSDIPALQIKGAACTPTDLARLAAYERFLCDFRYGDDPDGIKCPVTAHIRRSNPRDGLDPLLVSGATTSLSSTLSNRRRILRRGLPYGDASPPDDAGEHGVIFLALCASLFDQFEFVQQQWIQYGGSFNVGNDTDPLVGLRRPGAKFTIPADPAGSQLPFICAELPSFVETRGGEYFFLPSLTALREIAMGSVDPT